MIELDAALTAGGARRSRVTVPLRFMYVVRRNYLVWRKTMLVSLVGNLAAPLLWLFVLGLGLGARLRPIEGLSYLQFLGSGLLCSSVMNAASDEALFSAYERWKIRRTWEGILNAPMSVADVVAGEWIWAGIKGAIAGAAMLLVMSMLGLLKSAAALWMVPVMLLLGFAFSGIALVIIAVARVAEVRTFYFSLMLMPLMAISGVFFPSEQLPHMVQVLASFLPLSHAVALSRGFAVGAPLDSVLLHVSVIGLYAGFGALVATLLIRRRIALK